MAKLSGSPYTCPFCGEEINGYDRNVAKWDARLTETSEPVSTQFSEHCCEDCGRSFWTLDE